MGKLGKPIRTIEVDTGVDPGFLQNVLTQDITTLEALYDLIDNSIDAAKSKIAAAGDYKKDQYGLPESYNGFEIEIKIGKNSLSITDNCSGIDEHTFQFGTFHTGKTSNHPFGIGRFGVGLKRSLLKMGNSYEVAIDDASVQYIANFDKSNIGGALDNKMFANVYPSTGKIFSAFSVSDLHSEVVNDIHSVAWFENAVEGLNQRYGLYAQKGMAILLEDTFRGDQYTVDAPLPKIREDGKFIPINKNILIHGVSIKIRSGIHQNYFFPGEDQYSLSKNRTLTAEFGIYLICNDRVIVSASTASDYGWNAKWHSEYNGYICLVHFLAENPALLPLNSPKTAFRLDSPLFLEFKQTLQPIADHYRSEIKKRYSGDKNKSYSEKPKGKKSPQAKEPDRGQPKKRKPLPKDNRKRSTLIDWETCKTSVCINRTKEYAIFYELNNMNTETTPIASLVMLRVFIETTLKQTSKAIGIKWKSLAKTADEIAEIFVEQELIPPNLKLVISRFSNDKTSFWSFDNIQSLVHSVDFHPEKTQVNAYWDHLDPFLAVCWKKIQSKHDVNEIEAEC